jgi:CheY-like chemotaxis protein
MPARHDFHVAILGFSDFERSALASCFRLAGNRVPHYGQVPKLAEADFLVADSDHAPSVQLAVATGRIEQTVFVGTRPPADARTWLDRPIDPLHVMRELDAMVQTATDFPPPTPPRPATRELPGEDRDDTVPGVLSRSLAENAPTPGALLVDDSALALRFLETRLLPWGLQIVSTTHSRRALELLGQRSFRFAFLDVELGQGSELDGLALCRHIKQSPWAVGLTVFMISAHHGELHRVRGSLARCDGYLAKPLDERELARLLRRHGLRHPAQGPAVAAPRPG